MIESDICKNYLSGDSLRGLSNKFSLGIKPIVKILSKNGIKRRKNKYTLNELYFEKIDHCDKAYILGFLIADGSISSKNNTVKLCLKKEDSYILNYINNLINSNRPININKKYPSLSIVNKKIHNDLISLGLYPNKTFSVKIPKIPGNMFFHFLRGVFDGDGYLYIRKDRKATGCAGIVGHIDFLLQIQKILNKSYIASTIYKNSGNHPEIVELRVGKYNDIINLFEKMYNNCEKLFLTRKFDKFVELKTRHNSPRRRIK